MSETRLTTNGPPVHTTTTTAVTVETKPCARCEPFLVYDGPKNGGTQRRYDFPNGYGASVIRGLYTYGGEDGLFELAVFRGNDLCYDTPITSDVEGYLTPEAVEALLHRIADLPAYVAPAEKEGAA